MTVIEEIAAERRRQIEGEGWTLRHDDRHNDGSLARAAACYAAPDAVMMQWPDQVMECDSRRLVWPWDQGSWKPSTERRNLIKSAALIVAEIERLDRLEAKEIAAAST